MFGLRFDGRKNTWATRLLDRITGIERKVDLQDSRIKRLEKECDALQMRVDNPPVREVVNIPINEARVPLPSSEEICKAWNYEKSRWMFNRDLMSNVNHYRLYHDGVLIGCFSQLQCQRTINLACGEAVRMLLLRRS
jgi:hypothetical protein